MAIKSNKYIEKCKKELEYMRTKPHLYPDFLVDQIEEAINIDKPSHIIDRLIHTARWYYVE